MIWKTLIHTEAFYDKDFPHILLTAIDDYAEDREKKYEDVAGIFMVGVNRDEFAETHLDYYVEHLKKNITFISETPDKNLLEAWVFDKETLQSTRMKVCTTNDVNYDIWKEEDSFWDPSDFIFADETVRNTRSIESRLDGIEKSIEKILKELVLA